ncbi:MAG: PhzF family phenazine biosynthesis protein [Methylocystis sp.]
MAPLRFHTLDVFTRERFGGKPMVVFDDADALASNDMAALAREFNLPAAAFVRRSRDPVNSARIRVFSPLGEERSFSAQAVIGVAISLARSRAAEILARREVMVVLELADEILSCEVIRRGDGVCYAQFAPRHVARRAGEAPGVEALAEALGLAPADIGFNAHVASVYSAFAPFVFVPVASRAALERANPAPAHFGNILSAAAGVHVYSDETIAPDSTILARVFGPGGVEDPARGGAAAAFAALAADFERPEDGEHQIFIEQGHQIGRPSRLTLSMSIAAGALTNVHIGGQAVEIAHGELTF